MITSNNGRFRPLSVRLLSVLWVSLLSFFLIGSGCTLNNTKPPLNPLDIQALQSREFEQSKPIVFSSVMSVFQDLGYIVKSADLNTGFITAESAAKGGNSSLSIAMVSSSLSGVSEVRQTKATAFIEEIGAFTKVRLNFVSSRTYSGENGWSDRNDTAITEAKTYENAFEKIDNAIFVRTAQ